MAYGRSPVDAALRRGALSSSTAAPRPSRRSSRSPKVMAHVAGFSPVTTDVPVLAIRGLTVEYRVQIGLLTTRRVRAVDGIDLRIAEGQTVALVGESGSGKTSVARAIVGMAPMSGGSIDIAGHRLARSGHTRLRQVRRAV